MVTMSPSSSGVLDDKGRSKADLIIWDIRRGISCREMTCAFESLPILRWSYKDEYFACLRDSNIYIFETKSFHLLDKNPIKSPSGIRDYSWSPTDNIITYWVPESDNTPARVVLIEIPSRQELCTKNLFSVAEIGLIWHPQGDYLAVQGTYVNFEIVRMREKLYPVDQFEVKEGVACFQWEPTGSRFAFLQTSSTNKFSIAIYDCNKSGKVAGVAMLERASTRINELRWSPKGNILVVATLKRLTTDSPGT
ncbi:unnamed protein product [Protopolystoma xenopodis]|uniref:Translation initiation factor beta propellor-like domain-containing protein n=1 Tax=Protopolystoma xenopodis TaxID=117903 RepID=A0A3S5B4W9_9PLAT|nr:unnamed protein product [Protopolystoma xenopodis]